MHVLGVIVHVVEMNHALLMGLHNFRGQQQALGDVLGHLARHIVPLNGIHGGIFIGVFLHDLLIVALDEAENLVIGGVGGPGQRPGIAIADIALRRFIGAVAHQLCLHQLLNFLHVQRPSNLLRRGFHIQRDLLHLGRRQLRRLPARKVRLFNRRCDFFPVKARFTAVSFDNFHNVSAAPFCRKAKNFFPTFFYVNQTVL
ncbi:hypothetical protein SDC9_132281 [bioreactor metagenome]|uniref:Uncharacterized protein n=1 Tax=bioreactor metagenome TaxID=1076179 RepID=A0A645D8D3_9ZZZZ